MKVLYVALVVSLVACGPEGEILTSPGLDPLPAEHSPAVAIPAAATPLTATAPTPAPSASLVISTAAFVPVWVASEARLRVALGQNGCGYQLLRLEVVAPAITPYVNLFPSTLVFPLDDTLSGLNDVEVLVDETGAGACQAGDTVFRLAGYGFPSADPATGAITLGAAEFTKRKLLGPWECTKFFPAPATAP